MTMNRTALDGPAVMLFHSLADPARLAILRLLADGERRVVDLTAELGLAQSTVSGHLACLRSAGLVEAHPHGRATFYVLANSELWGLMAAAEKALGVSGTTVELCPEHHRPAAVTCGSSVHGCLAHAEHGREPHEHPGTHPAPHPATHPGRH
ncbi:DNA-binding transcriptional ArsR family regulator [Haloactinopolyspora alba]|uniref:DNA-binding transcriptional ArsR family regulator n=1 Tax=Haloactinopolyspora alba TaxID=648780 RepID=A0A2P8DJ79_9ACTN|nr:metalloregulator ArsR/SmtB family transcription factor [Haloactinopolyspora alba]PSK97229.1 DNA-binding transcriptional ArsR family regulator [Haloactinopolyspora alba]